MLSFTLEQIAGIVGGKLEGGAPDTQVYTLCKIEEGHPGGLTFLANPKYTPYIYETQASAVIVNSDFTPEQPVKTALIRVGNSYESFAKLLAFYNEYTTPKPGVSPLAYIAPDAKIGKDVYVGEFAVIAEGAEIGNGCKIYPQCYVGSHARLKENCILYPGVKIYSFSQIGKSCILQAGAVIGADGFGFAPNNGSYEKIPQIGNVVLEDNVEIGANTCVDKATMGSTVIKEGTKLDNLIQIGHNVVVGKNTVMASQVGIAGSTKVGDNCMFGGQVGIAGHSIIANGVKLGAQSGVPGSIRKENVTLLGSPPIDPATFIRATVHFKNFDSLVERLKAVEKELNELKNKA
ncbi:MAG: UDP-3-O-(3-hydroxymyristoyl)glucosamine N-acyltransferase [Bacteroidales bacterium]|nr:UDP-3-O-(3-hydroxymyristoyl)glucosamine N-acyltransferase [Bacteroidales bacterium]